MLCLEQFGTSVCLHLLMSLHHPAVHVLQEHTQLQVAPREEQTQHPLPHRAGPTAQRLAHTVGDPQVHLAQAPSTTGQDLAPTMVGQAWQQQAAAANSSSTAGQVPTTDLLALHHLRAITPGGPTLARGVAAVAGGDPGVGGRTPMTPTPSMAVRGAGVTLAGVGLVWLLADLMVAPMHLQVSTGCPWTSG
jgi:hypothetical protein